MWQHWQIGDEVELKKYQLNWKEKQIGTKTVTSKISKDLII